MSPLDTRDCWIFDMDGTLTVPAHDFEAIRKTMGLATDEPILEAIERMPEAQARAALTQLNDIEMEIARDSIAGEGVETFLAELASRELNLGIVTRNGYEIAKETLRACGLLKFFDTRFIMGREQAQPKPKPDGIEKLLDMWQAPAERAVMVGDYYYDLAAGRTAGTATVYLNVRGESVWSEYADVTVERLDALLGWLD